MRESAERGLSIRAGPTSSTTAALVMGDALAVALLEARGFTAEDFALSHPGGALGRKLLLRVNDIMHTGDEIPHVGLQATLRDALLEITRKNLGMTAICDDDMNIIGIFTDGDLRRVFDTGVDMRDASIADVMTREDPHPSRHLGGGCAKPDAIPSYHLRAGCRWRPSAGCGTYARSPARGRSVSKEK